MTQSVNDDGERARLAVGPEALARLVEDSAIARFEVRTPTLPPATHTNVYIMGQGSLVVVDPASPYEEEQAALERVVLARIAGGERVEAILLTHHHVDHVSGASALKRATGAPILAHPLTAERLVGRIPVDATVEAGARLPVGGREVEAVLTPGHAPGHLCLLDRRSRVMVCGDMVASVGTILVDPDDDGDMAIYIASLEHMRTLAPSCLLPSHGPPIGNADEHLAFYVAHRLAREAKVLDALDASPRDLDALVPIAYRDVAPEIYPLAKRSLRAHLDKLVREGRAHELAGRWSRA